MFKVNKVNFEHISHYFLVFLLLTLNNRKFHAQNCLCASAPEYRYSENFTKFLGEHSWRLFLEQSQICFPVSYWTWFPPFVFLQIYDIFRTSIFFYIFSVSETLARENSAAVRKALCSKSIQVYFFYWKTMQISSFSGYLQNIEKKKNRASFFCDTQNSFLLFLLQTFFISLVLQKHLVSLS